MAKEALKLCIYLHVEKVLCSCKVPENTRAGKRTSKSQLPEGTGELYISIWYPDDRKQTISQSEIFWKTWTWPNPQTKYLMSLFSTENC